MIRREFILKSLGALGSAALGVVGTLIVQGRSHADQMALAEAARLAQIEADRKRFVETLVGSFDDLGDIARRAVEFAETGRVGGPDDVRAVKRHFDRVIRAVHTGMASRADILRYYGGRIRGWAVRFTDLSENRSPVSRRFSAYEHHNFRAIGQALAAIANANQPGGSPPGEEDEAINIYYTIENSAEPVERAMDVANGM